MNEEKKRPETPHIKAFRNQDRLKRLATERFRVREGKLKKYRGFGGQDVEAAVTAITAAGQRARAEADAGLIAAAKPGDMIEGHGIFLGVWEPKDSAGNSLRKTFNVFAAPENLGETLEYARTVRKVADLKGWHGHDGEYYASDKDLYSALAKGAYKGGWFIPTNDLLSGKDSGNRTVMPDNLFAHRHTGAFRDTFKMQDWGDSTPEWYWSCTSHRDYPYRAYAVRFSNGYDFEFVKDRCRFSCRPVRLEPKR